MREIPNTFINQIFSFSLGLMPLLVLTFHSGIHIASLSLLIISCFILFKHRGVVKPLTNIEWIFVMSLCLLPTVILFDCLLRNSAFRYLDYPLRFIILLPVFFAMRKVGTLSIEPMVYGLYAGSIAAGCIALYQATYLDIPRVYGNLHITTFGHISAALSLLSFNTLLLSKKLKKHLIILALVAGVMGGVATYLSGTRASWLAAVPCCLIWLVNAQISTKTKYLAITVLAFSLFSFYSLNSSFQNRINKVTLDTNAYFSTQMTNTSIGARWEMWKGAIYLFKDNPLLGTSMGGYKLSMAEKNKLGIINASKIFDHAHNASLHYLVTLGIVGFFSYIILFVGPIYFFSSKLGTEMSPEKRFTVISGLIILSSYITFDLAGFSFGHQHTAVFLAVMLISFAGFTCSTKINKFKE